MEGYQGQTLVLLSLQCGFYSVCFYPIVCSAFAVGFVVFLCYWELLF